jgi:hypothetical protein
MGVRHSIEAETDGLYEASVLGLCAFHKHERLGIPGGIAVSQEKYASVND